MSDAAHDPGADGAWRRRAVSAATLVLGAASLVGFAGNVHWTLDLLSHFRLHFALSLALASVLCLFVRARVAAVVAAGCLAVQVGTLLPFFLRPELAQADVGTRWRLLLCNVHTSNRDFAAVRSLLLQEDPDLVVLQETDRRWLQALADLQGRWPYRVESPRDDNFGIAVWSRYPLRGARLVNFGGAGLPSVVTDVLRGADVLSLVATHAIPPVGAVRTRLRDEDLMEAARCAASQPGPVLLVGDFNTTPWSPVFRQMLAKACLRDSAEGFGLQATWPSRLSVLGIPLDHCLCSAGVRVLDRRVGPHVGSDHRPLVVDIALVRAPVTSR
ncbi:MAG: endonuclease/exonuclease/phosphatase family protein [Planctomycetota bacterium]